VSWAPHTIRVIRIFELLEYYISHVIDIIVTPHVVRIMSVSVIIPTYKTDPTLLEKTLRSIPRKVGDAEVEIVIATEKDDRNAFSIAEKFRVRAIAPERRLGKGHAMETAFNECEGELIVFFDADIKNVNEDMMRSLIIPLIEGAEVTRAKYEYQGNMNFDPVSELVARPLLSLFFPEIRVKQPLTGLSGYKRYVLEGCLPFEKGWGVDVGLLIDVTMKACEIVEVDIGVIEHEFKPWEEQFKVAHEVARTILRKAVAYARIYFI